MVILSKYFILVIQPKLISICMIFTIYKINRVKKVYIFLLLVQIVNNYMEKPNLLWIFSFLSKVVYLKINFVYFFFDLYNRLST